MILAFAFWWWLLLDLDGQPVQRHARFLTWDDCEAERGLYERIIEESGRTDRTVGLCQWTET